MDARGFLDNFNAIADAPGGPQRLRGIILDLAFHGKLVPTEASDGTQGALLAPGAAFTEVPGASGIFPLPARWRWVRFADVAETRLGKMLDKARNTGSLRPYLRNANVQWFRFALTDLAELRLEDKDYEAYSLRVGDLVVCEGGEPGRAAVCDQSVGGMVFQKALHRARPHPGVNVWYLAYLLRWYATSGRLAPYFTGATIRHLTGRSLAVLPLPLPPPGEQDRIVAAIHLLMAQCDEVEVCREYLRTATSRFRRSALHALTEANGSALHTAWDRISSGWEAIFDHPDSVGDIRRTILQLAVQGRLDAQDPADERAAVAVARGKAAKSTVLAGLRTQPAVPQGVSPSSLLPNGWTWALVDDVFLVSGGVQKSPARRPVSTHYPYLRVANVQRGRLDLSEIERFELSDGELERLRLEPGDLLVVEGNGSESEIGRCARWEGAILDCVHQNHLIRCRPMLADLERFLLLYLNSPQGMDTMKALAVTTSGLYNLSVGKIRSIRFPMPPMAEQDRIRHTVATLMQRCDALEQRLLGKQGAQRLLAVSPLVLGPPPQ